MARALITGNLGYNGLWVTRRLNEEGHETLGLDTDYYRHCCFFDYQSFLPKTQILKDIRQIEKKDFLRSKYFRIRALKNLLDQGKLKEDLSWKIKKQGKGYLKND